MWRGCRSSARCWAAGRRRIGVLNNAKRPHLEEQYRTLDAEASRLKLTLVRKDAASLSEIDAAFKSFKGGPRIDALLVTANSLFNDLRQKVVGFADGMPAIYQWREFAEAGGYMSFGPNIIEAYQQVAVTPRRSLAAKIRRTCRWRYRHDSNSSSTSMWRMRAASEFRRRCCRVPSSCAVRS